MRAPSGFTLAEIMVAVAIASLLAVAGLWAYASTAESARDAARADRLAGLASALGQYRAAYGRYPAPDGARAVTCHGAPVWTQGVFGDVAAAVSGLGRPPRDPLVPDLAFSYSLTASGAQYEVASITEGDAYERDGAYRVRAKVVGNYNRLVLPCGQRLAAVPSITLSRLAAADLAAGFPQDAFVVDGFENAPAAYSGTAYWTSSEYRYAPAVSDPFPGRPTAAQASAFASASYSGTEFARTGLWRSVAALDPGSDASEALGTSLVSGFSEAAEGPAYAGTSCDALPRWANARFAPGSPTAQRQPWQNGNPLAPCHYECLADWKGEGCADRDAACWARHGSFVAELPASDSGLCRWDSGSLLPWSFLESPDGYSWTCAGIGSSGAPAACSASKP